jgi:glutaminyl-tRNA synthetase
VVELHGTLDPDTRPGGSAVERKVKGTIHWVSALHAIDAEVRLYDRLFDIADPDDDGDGKTYKDHLNPQSRRVVRGWLEPAAASAVAEQHFQFERLGYFVADRVEHTPQRPVFNRTVTLRDVWAAKS